MSEDLRGDLERASKGWFRIVAVAETWSGANGYGYVRAFRRAGHSVTVVPAEEYIPRCRSSALRLARRLLQRGMIREHNSAIVAVGRQIRPHVFFVYKGSTVSSATVRSLRDRGAVAVCVYPDVSFYAHGPLLPQALPEYDWVFSTKTFGLEDLRRHLNVCTASLLQHAADPEVHRSVALSEEEERRLGCDVSFIGTWSPKKQIFLEALCADLRGLRLRVYGEQWQRAGRRLMPWVQGHGVLGLEYAKAIGASRVNLCILSEARLGASRGDQVTSRTFHIPAAGGFLLHERTQELASILREGIDCGAFESKTEMVGQVHRWCAEDAVRRRVAIAGQRRILEDGHTMDHRARRVLEKVESLRASRAEVQE